MTKKVTVNAQRQLYGAFRPVNKKKDSVKEALMWIPVGRLAFEKQTAGVLKS